MIEKLNYSLLFLFRVKFMQHVFEINLFKYAITPDELAMIETLNHNIFLLFRVKLMEHIFEIKIIER